MSGPSFEVIVPTWRRPEPLAVCLRALASQTLGPARVIVPVKSDDSMSIDLLSRLAQECGLSVTVIHTPPTGNFKDQLNAGIAESTAALVAMTDDDAEPRPDWLERMAGHFNDPTVGGVGGRDWQAHDRRSHPVVGKVSWFGRVTGNHHIGVGPAREVDLLKGVNWAFRGDLLRAAGIDTRLRGRGTVMNTEMSVCFALRRQGWKLVYDPAIAVEHHVAPRSDGDVNTRGGFEPASFADAVHNETLAMLTYLSPPQRAAFVAWAILIGSSGVPGVAQIFRLWLSRRRAGAHALSDNLFGRWRAAGRGRLAGLRTFTFSRRSL